MGDERKVFDRIPEQFDRMRWRYSPEMFAALADALDRVYDRHFVTETPYTHRGFRYENATNYGFADYHVLEFKSVREFDADGYVEYIGTHADHIGLVEPHRSAFFGGIRDAIEQHGGKLVMNLTDYLRLTRKP